MKISCQAIHHTDKKITSLIQLLMPDNDNIDSVDIIVKRKKWCNKYIIIVKSNITRFEFTEVSGAPEKWKLESGNIDSKYLPFIIPLDNEKCYALNKFFNNLE
ncbi:MAG: hypothetical protein ACD_33C00002G0023 [uncultured bacterium]|nr:MAG: hypothetical protein ACD_33C00002G0023 [uncultured bacterium]